MLQHAETMVLSLHPLAQVLAVWNVPAVLAKVWTEHQPVTKRLESMKRMLENEYAGTIEAPTVAVLGSLDGQVRFLDGRHRFHALAQAGAKRIVMATTMQMLETAVKFQLVEDVSHRGAEGAEESER